MVTKDLVDFSIIGVWRVNYTPVVTETATELVLSAIAIKGLYAEQVDFITAHLNAQLTDRKLYMLPRVMNKATRLLSPTGVVWASTIGHALEQN